MRLEMELEFDKYCVVDESPTTVLPSPQRRPKVEKKKSRRSARRDNDILSLKEGNDFTEIRFHRYRSASCKVIPSSRIASLEGNAAPRRGSVCQSSKEVRQMKKIDAVKGRRKIEISRSSATAFSFGIVDSLCSSDEDSSLEELKRSSVMSVNSGLSITGASKSHIEVKSRNCSDLSFQHVPEVPLESYNIENQCARKAERQALQDCKLTSKSVIYPLNDGNVAVGRDPSISLNKSLSAKLSLPYLPACSESDSSQSSSPKIRFTPIRKMFDPFVKSKSHKCLNSTIEPGRKIPSGLGRTGEKKAIRKSLLHNFSNTMENLEYDSQPVKKENQNSPVQCSPTYLHGILKLKHKDRVPLFEFAVKCLEDVLVAKTWNVKDSSARVYTFHSVQNKSKSNASGWGVKDSKTEFSMVGQMQFSCYLRKELKEAALDKSMVAEFVLYDIARLRKSVSSGDGSSPSPDVAKRSTVLDEKTIVDNCDLDEKSTSTKIKSHSKHTRTSGQFDLSNFHPIAAAELHPELQNAAIVVQLPFVKRGSMNFTSGDTKIGQPLPTLLDLCQAEQKNGVPESFNPTKVNVMIPSGNHGLPTTKCRGPSPLLDRWRLGGGCDCGGWDMACPLHLFNNSSILTSKDHHPLENQWSFELFVQGKKDNEAALTMMLTEDGHYAVDFNAQLSALQAFSICISILHTIETSSVVSGAFVEEKITNLLDAVKEEERWRLDKKMEEVLSSFIVYPPFSPIARV